MSDFRCLKEFIVIISEACRPFADVSVSYLKNIVSHEYSTKLALDLRTSYKSAIDELANNLPLLPDNLARVSYLNEVRLLTHKHAALYHFVMHQGKTMFDALINSGDQRTVKEQAYSKLYSVVHPHLERDLRAGLATNSLSNNNRGHVALLQVVGTGAYECWKQLDEEIDRQLRLLQALKIKKRSSASFNEAHFLAMTGMEKSMLELIDAILVEDMKAIRVTSEGNFELVDAESMGRPLMALSKMLTALGEANEQERGHQIAWVRFFEYRYIIIVSEACRRYKIESDNKLFQEDLRDAFLAIIKRTPKLKGLHSSYQAFLGSYRQLRSFSS